MQPGESQGQALLGSLLTEALPHFIPFDHWSSGFTRQETRQPLSQRRAEPRYCI